MSPLSVGSREDRERGGECSSRQARQNQGQGEAEEGDGGRHTPLPHGTEGRPQGGYRNEGQGRGGSEKDQQR